MSSLYAHDSIGPRIDEQDHTYYYDTVIRPIHSYELLDSCMLDMLFFYSLLIIVFLHNNPFILVKNIFVYTLLAVEVLNVRAAVCFSTSVEYLCIKMK